jgi:hypothetical protein
MNRHDTLGDSHWRKMMPGLFGTPFFGDQPPMLKDGEGPDRRPVLTGRAKVAFLDMSSKEDRKEYARLTTEFVKPNNSYRYTEQFFQFEDTVKVLVKYVECFMVMPDKVEAAHGELDSRDGE